MICPRCGKELPDGSVFCNECGQTIDMNTNLYKKTEYPDLYKPKISLWETFKNAIKSFCKDFTKGRASRKEFWSTYLFSVLLLLIPWILCFIIMMVISANPDSVVAMVLFIPLFILIIPFEFFGVLFEIAILRLWIQRAHDTDNSCVCIFIPFYRIILLFLPGTNGPNKYGEKPEN